MAHRSVGLSIAALLSLACGPGRSEPSDGTTSGSSGTALTNGTSDPSASSADGSADTTTGGTDDAPPFEPISCERTNLTMCPAPWPDEATYFQCSATGTCESLRCDPNNCGECGHKCGGPCIDGECWSVHGSCIHQDDEITTCAQACAEIGALCEDRLSAESGHLGCDRGFVFATGFSLAGDPACPAPAQTAETYIDAECDAPISWDNGTAEDPQTGVSCCCKGDVG